MALQNAVTAFVAAAELFHETLTANRETISDIDCSYFTKKNCAYSFISSSTQA